MPWQTTRRVLPVLGLLLALGCPKSPTGGGGGDDSGSSSSGTGSGTYGSSTSGSTGTTGAACVTCADYLTGVGGGAICEDEVAITDAASSCLLDCDMMVGADDAQYDLCIACVCADELVACGFTGYQTPPDNCDEFDPSTTSGVGSTGASTSGGGDLIDCDPAQAEFDSTLNIAHCAIDLVGQTCSCMSGDPVVEDVLSVTYVSDGMHVGVSNGLLVTDLSHGTTMPGGDGSYTLLGDLPSDTPISATLMHAMSGAEVTIEFTIGSDNTLSMSAGF